MAHEQEYVTQLLSGLAGIHRIGATQKREFDLKPTGNHKLTDRD